MSTETRFEVYKENGLLGLKQNGVRVTEPIYVFLGCSHYDMFVKDPVISFVRREYIRDENKYFVGQIDRSGFETEKLSYIYHQAKIDEIYKNIIKAENFGKIFLHNLYMQNEILPRDIADEIYRPVYVDFDKKYVNPDVAMIEIGEEHNLIHYLLGKKISARDFDYVLIMEYNHVQLKKICTFYVKNIEPGLTSVENIMAYVFGLKVLDYEIEYLQKIYELIAKFYDLK